MDSLLYGVWSAAASAFVKDVIKRTLMFSFVIYCISAPTATAQTSFIDSARSKFTTGSGYRLASGKNAFDILEQVATTEELETHKNSTIPLPTVLKQYRTPASYRQSYFSGTYGLASKLAEDFVPGSEGLPGDTYDQLKALLHSTETVGGAGADAQKEWSFRRFPDAELMLASDNLLVALDSRFSKQTNEEANEGEEEEEPGPPPSPVPLFDRATDEAGKGLRSWWLIRQDVELLDHEYTPIVVNGRQFTPLPLESLFMQLQERRLQAKINGAKKIFNESARGKQAAADIQQDRDEAETRLQEVGFESYLSLAMLGAAHEESTDFSNSGAGELRTKLGVASRVYSMIRSGKQPDGYIESFIPNRNPAELYADAVTATLSAIAKENVARSSKREQLLSFGQIANEISSQRQSFRYPLEQLSGFRFETKDVKHRGKTLMIKVTNELGAEEEVPLNPLDLEHRGQFFKEVDLRVGTILKAHFDEISRRTQSITESIHREQGDPDIQAVTQAVADLSKKVNTEELSLESFGALGGNAIEIQKALTAVNQAFEGLKHELERILDEKQYAADLEGINRTEFNTTKRVLKNWCKDQEQIAADQVTYSSTTVSASAGVNFGPTGPTPFVSAGISTNPMQKALADASKRAVRKQVDKDILLATARLDREAAERALGLQKTLKELFRSFEARVGTLQQTLLALESARNAYAMNRSRLESLVEDWAATKHLAGQQFEGYAAQCVQRETSRIDADQALADAVTAGYLAAKAMQYVWVERYSNPVTVMGTGTDVVLPKEEFRPFTNPESILGARNANELRDFLEAIYVWHNTLASGLRGSPRGNEVRFTKMISLRRDILGLDEYILRPTDDGTSTLNDRRKDRLSEFRDWLEVRLYEQRGSLSAFAFQFATDIDSDKYFPRDEWNQKILRIGINFVGDHLPVASPSVSLTQSGTVSVRRFPPVFGNIERYSLSGYGLNEFEEVFGRPAEQRTYDKITEVQIQASRRDFLKAPEQTMSSALVDMSVAADRWAFFMNFNDPANRLRSGDPFPIRRLTDVELIFMYSFNHPRDDLAVQLQHEVKRFASSITQGSQ